MPRRDLKPLELDPASGPVEIGRCRSVRLTCLSEVGWWDDAEMLAPVQAAGGMEKAEQWRVEWDNRMAAGCSHLVEVEGLDGTVRRLLLDTAWSPLYQAWRLMATGVDRLLAEGEVDALYLSHEHMDHFWGLEATLAADPELTVLAPSTFSLNAVQFLYGKSFPRAGAVNDTPLRGELLKMPPGKVHKLWDGCASLTFDLPIILGIRGEQSLVFHLEDQGLVLVTGCCHQGVLNFLDQARQTIAGGDKLHGIYGGLHLAPFGAFPAPAQEAVRALGGYGLAKIAVNHCTGLPAVEMMRELGYPVLSSSGTQGSRSSLYLGNGDQVTFA